MPPQNVFDDVKTIFEADTSTYMSLPFLTKYEFNQLIGLRTLQLSNGAIPFVEIPVNYNIKTNMQLREIAIRELKEHKLPYIVKRQMPNGNTEYWPVSKLNLDRISYLLDNN